MLTNSVLVTITSSALFERRNVSVSREIHLNRHLELRQLPIRTEEEIWRVSPSVKDGILPMVPNSLSLHPLPKNASILTTEQLENSIIIPPKHYWTKPEDWIYSAMLQLTRNGSDPSWSKEGWSFVPIDIGKPLTMENITVRTTHLSDCVAKLQQRFSFVTSAIRGRVECDSSARGYSIQNKSSWVDTYDLGNSKLWSQHPANISKAYWFKYDDVFFASPYRFNEWCPMKSSQNYMGGRWSSVYNGRTEGFPYPFSSWPINFTATYLSGPAQSGFIAVPELFVRDANVVQRPDLRDLSYKLITAAIGPCQGNGYQFDNIGLFTGIPFLQSLECRPVIEKADSQVTVDRNGRILSYKLQEKPMPTDAPWKDVFVMYTQNEMDGDAPPKRDPRFQGLRRNVTSR